MPAIKEYNSPNAAGGLRINNSGISALEAEASQGVRMATQAASSTRQEGEAYGGAIKATGQVAQEAFDKYVVQPEISKGAAALAGYQDDLTTKWNTLAKGTDPNDATIKQKFMQDELEPALQKFNDSFQTAAGKKFAEDQSNAFRKHMFEKTTADVSTRAGEALVANITTMKNTLSNSVRQDPSSYEQASALVRASIKEQVANTPGLSVATAARIEGTLSTNIQSELAKATILGVAEKNPDQAQKMIDSGKFDKLIDGTEMSNMVKTMKNASRADQNYARIQQDRAEQDRSDKAKDGYVQQMYSGKGPLPSVRQIALDPAFEGRPNDRKAMLDLAMARSQQTPDAPVVQDNTATVNELASRLTDPTKNLSLNDLLKASHDKEITDATFNRLNTLRQAVDAEPLKNPAFKSVIDAGEVQLSGSNTFMKDPEGDKLVSQWKLNVLPQLIQMQKAGKLSPADMDLGNPNSYISQSLAPFQRSTADKLAALKANVGAPPAPTSSGTAAPAPKPDFKFSAANPPEPLKGIASRTMSPSTGQILDDATGDIYTNEGVLIRKGTK